MLRDRVHGGPEGPSSSPILPLLRQRLGMFRSRGEADRTLCVEIVPLGPISHEQIIDTAVRRANRGQRNYRLAVGEPVVSLGGPDGRGRYRFAHLAERMIAARQSSNTDILVGVIDQPLCDELFSGTDRESLAIVVSLDSITDLLQSTGKSPADYLLVEIGAQLLTIEYRRATGLQVDAEHCALPWHRETRSCIFDYCDDRPQSSKKMMEPQLCSACRAALEKANVRHSRVAAAVRIVQRGVDPRAVRLLRDASSRPLIQFLFGGFLFATAQGVAQQLGASWWAIPAADAAVVTGLAALLYVLKRPPRIF